MANRLPHLVKNRHGTYYFRLYISGREQRLSLGTKDFQRAKIQVLELNLKLAMSIDPDKLFRKLDIVVDPDTGQVTLKDVKEADINTAQSILSHLGVSPAQAMGVDHLLAPQPKKSKTSKPIPLGSGTGQAGTFGDMASPAGHKNIRDVIKLYLTEKKLDNVEKTLYDKEVVYNDFIEFHCARDKKIKLGDKPRLISLYDPDDAVAYKNHLLELSGSASSINGKLSYLRNLFDYAVNNHLYFLDNPFAKVKISSKAKLKAQVESYQAFTEEELQTIFDEQVYRDYMNKPDYYWLPFLSLYSGARIEELASLKLSNIYKENGVWIFDIRHFSAKNKNSTRKIPLHRMIENSTFFAYVQQVKMAGEEQLFPHLVDGKNGFSKNCSRRFGQYLDLLEITDKRKVFHSFRSNVINQLTNRGIHPAIIMGLVGHYEQAKIDFSSPHFNNYQEQKPIEILKEAIDRLEYPIKNFHKKIHELAPG